MKCLKIVYGIKGLAIFPAPTSSFEMVWKHHNRVLFRIKFMSLVDEELLTNTKLIRLLELYQSSRYAEICCLSTHKLTS
uniref:Ovule protein n=1 Tax=Romanomermis culicivorax TaxID=13658 RepID=A0A915IFQ7_ROMCU